MINQFAKLRVTDTSRCTHMSCTVSDLMSMHISKMDDLSIDLKNESVYVGTGTGYTRLLEIHLSEIHEPWMTIAFPRGIIRVSKDTLIPIYDESAIVGYRGFHGEIKRDPKEIYAIDIEEYDGFLMVYDRINKEPIFRRVYKTATIENPVGVFGKYGYELKTESEFIDINNVSIYAK